MVLYCPECGEHAYYKNPADKANAVVSCKNHMIDGMGMVYIKTLRYACAFAGCPTTASWGFNGNWTHCKNHSKENMEKKPRPEKASLKCKEKGCNKVACVGEKDDKEKRKLYCPDHGDEDTMINFDKTDESCNHPLCSRVATHGTKNPRELLCCIDHVKDGMELIPRHRICIVCGINATYGVPGQPPQYCKTHALNVPGTEDLNHAKCIKPGCTTRPWTNGSGTPYCSNHCPKGNVKKLMDNILDRIDEYFNPTIFRRCRSLDHAINEEVRACYGLKLKKPLTCAKHKEDYYFDVVHPLCIVEGCVTRAGFGEEDGPAIYCAKHNQGLCGKSLKQCKADGCNITVCYGIPDETPTHCATHADRTIMKPIWATCLFEGCGKHRRYGSETDGKKLFCAEHANKNTMIPFGYRKCDDCNISATFRLKGTTTPTHCATHRNPLTMESINRKCDKCDTQPTFGLIGIMRATHCFTHHDPNTMEDTRHPKCQVEGCGKRPNYGIEDRKGIYCSEHGKERKLSDTVSPRCEKCNIISVNRNYKPYCARCYYDENPTAERSINFKTKELAFTDVVVRIYHQKIKNCWPKVEQDRVIAGGTSKRRPDALMTLIDANMNKYFIVIEIDEFQHSVYESEEERLEQIHADLNHRSLTVIRLNPDGYRAEDGSNVKSCFSNETGSLVLQDDLFKPRLEALLYAIRRAIANRPANGKMNIMKLFYSVIPSTEEVADDIARMTL